MTTTLILIRHGNTFEAGEASRMVGKAEDFPLVPKGFEQAATMGKALQATGVAPYQIVSSPATRCKQTAGTLALAGGYNLAIGTDERLAELDYGTWSGKTDAELTASTPEGAQEAWRKQGVIPEGAGWQVANALSECQSFLHDISTRNGTVVAVTHGGRVRFFREAVVGERTESLKTAHAAIFNYANGMWKIQAWNVLPTSEMVQE